ncbi:MAG TPA: TetR/AcrR family transcriptional regulator [Myxococcaceae bacterium]|nr:TetR/AcrR family transcriptional regulator [Myxococcaceae bacterium]
MGTAARRERERSELRTKILDAARSIVLHEGFGALTIRKLAEAIEYAPGTIYLYFENRDAIARELSSEGFQSLLEVFAPAGDVADPFARLEAIGRAYVRFGMENPETYRLIFMEDPQLTTAVFKAAGDDPGQRAYRALIDPLEGLRAAGRLRPDSDVQALADTLWSVVHGIVSLKLTCPGFPVTPVEPLVDTALRTFLDGMVRPAAVAKGSAAR